ncbi:hypothetical protein Tco_0273088 [Tanacetum coccineum]
MRIQVEFTFNGTQPIFQEHWNLNDASVMYVKEVEPVQDMTRVRTQNNFASFEEEKESLRTVEAQILSKRLELSKFETEYKQVLAQFTEMTSRYAQEMQEPTNLYKTTLLGLAQVALIETSRPQRGLVYENPGDNFFKSVSYTIEVVCTASFEEKESLRTVEAQILSKRLELSKFETEYKQVG